MIIIIVEMVHLDEEIHQIVNEYHHLIINMITIIIIIHHQDQEVIYHVHLNHMMNIEKIILIIIIMKKIFMKMIINNQVV
jgi:hypothetical protein